MRASTFPGLEEKYIVAISRELAVALKYVHEVGVIHRDVKAANVLIHQDGQLQLCDFGVSGILESSVAKRSTIIGTPNWMPPEMHDDSMPDSYGTEIDCWAFGCTAYELATGQPPNVGIDPARLHLFLKKAPRLEGENYSGVLREFVSYCLEENPAKRPSAGDILKHRFVSDTAKSHPTTSLRELIERYAHWEQLGGQRQSLFDPRGATVATTPLDPIIDEDDEWNFSTTDEFDLEMLQEEGVFPEELDQLGASEGTSVSPPTMLMTPFERVQFDQRVRRAETQLHRVFDPDAPPYEHSACWDDETGYEAESDLPLRTTGEADVRESVIDLDAAVGEPHSPTIDLGNIPTLKAGSKRHQFIFDEDEEEGEDVETRDEQPLSPNHDAEKRTTMAWKFPVLTMPTPGNRKTLDWTFPSTTAELPRELEISDETVDYDLANPTPQSAAIESSRPRLRHMVTEPIGQFDDHLHGPPGFGGQFHVPSESIQLDLDDEHRSSLLDLSVADRESVVDLGESETASAVDNGSTTGWTINTDGYSRPTTSYSSTAESSMSETSTGNPFDIGEVATATQRGSLHGHSQSEPQSYRTSKNEFEREYEHLAMQNAHTRGSSWSNDVEPNLSRAPSVKASMDSLRKSRDEDDDSSPQDQMSRPQVLNGSRNARERGVWHSATPSTLNTSTMRRAFPMVNGIEKTLRPRGRRGLERGRAEHHAPPPVESQLSMPDFMQTQHYPIPEAPLATAFHSQASQEAVMAEVKKVLIGATLSSRQVGEVDAS